MYLDGVYIQYEHLVSRFLNLWMVRQSAQMVVLDWQNRVKTSCEWITWDRNV